MKKRIFLFLCAISLILSAIPAYAAGEQSFTDVPVGAYYTDAVAWAVENGITGGVGGGRFDPDGTCTRSQTVTFLWRAYGSPEPAGKESPFTDVNKNDFFFKAALWASEKGITGGVGGGRFAPNDPCTRSQMVTFLWRAAGKPPVSEPSAFSDVAAGEFYADAVSWASGLGVVQGLPDGTFGVQGLCTRGQAVTFLWRQMGWAMAEVPVADKMFEPCGILAASDGTLLVTDTFNNMIWRVENGQGKVYAGSATAADMYGRPVGGYKDAGLLVSTFRSPWAIAPFLDGYAVSDPENNVVRLVTSAGVRTLNGHSRENLAVSEKGVTFEHPTGLTVDNNGTLYVSDTFRGAVRSVSRTGYVSTLISGLNDPMGLCWHEGTLYIAETGANRVVRVSQDGKLEVVAGSGTEGYADGAPSSAAFSGPQGVVVDEDGTVYVADTGNGAVRRVRDGWVDTVVMRDVSDQDDFFPVAPTGLAVSNDTLYVCDTFACKVVAIGLKR